MKIIVSTELRQSDFPDYLVVPNLSQPISTLQDVTCVILHTFEGNPNNLVQTLTILQKRNSFQVHYVANPDRADSSVKGVVVGMKGSYTDDEFYLDDQQTLDHLVSSNKELSVRSSEADAKVLNNFIETVGTGKEITPFHMKAVEKAVSNLHDSLEVAKRNAEELSGGVTALLDQSYNVARNLQRKLREIREQQREIDDRTSKVSALPQTSGVSIYPPVRSTTTKLLIRIKAPLGMLYLTSFAMGLQNHLKHVLHKRPRLIFVEDIGALYQQRYRDYSWVGPRTPRDDSAHRDEIVFVNQPSQSLITDLINNENFDSVIVIDRTSNSTKHIVQTAWDSKVIYAVNGVSVQKALSLPSKRCILSVQTNDNFLFTVSMFQAYPSPKDARLNSYARVYRDQYDRLVRASAV